MVGRREARGGRTMDVMHDGIAIDVSFAEDTRVVEVSGEIDFAVARYVEEALVPGDQDVIVDLSNVTFLDSSGIAAMVRAHLRQLAEGHGLAIRGATGPVSRVLQITGVDATLPRAS